jgi:hypothetical protein
MKLINYLWKSGHLTGGTFRSLTGESVEIISPGERDDTTPGLWNAAEVMVDGERRRGTVAVGEDTPVPDNAVLRVVGRACAPVLGTGDTLVTQIERAPEPAAADCYDRLRAGIGRCDCAARIARMDSLRRTSLLTSLLVERLKRKTDNVARVFAASGCDWNQTFHVLLFTAMGGDRNHEPFVALADRATIVMASREKGSVVRIEALLLGTAGFLFEGSGARGGDTDDFDEKDNYTLTLEEEARHLFAKHSITPLKPAVWNLSGIYPVNHPAVRLAQIAALMCKTDFMLDSALACRTSEDVERLFCVSASDYWRTHFTPSGRESAPSVKSIGRAKARLIGINLVAPLMFAYGRQTGTEELCERALDLLTTIPAEKNRVLAPWYEGGCVAESGFESQALLQLATEYCARGLCADCPIGRTEIKNSLISSTTYNLHL